MSEVYMPTREFAVHQNVLVRMSILNEFAWVKAKVISCNSKSYTVELTENWKGCWVKGVTLVLNKYELRSAQG
jgi:hypothetical protein